MKVRELGWREVGVEVATPHPKENFLASGQLVYLGDH